MLGDHRVLIAALLLAAMVVATGYRAFTPELASPASPPRATAEPSDTPCGAVTEDHRFARLQHKDKRGKAPLEIIATENGLVTVQRTFSSKGELLKEEAFLDGNPVPMPKSLGADVKLVPLTGDAPITTP